MSLVQKLRQEQNEKKKMERKPKRKLNLPWHDTQA